MQSALHTYQVSYRVYSLLLVKLIFEYHVLGKQGIERHVITWKEYMGIHMSVKSMVRIYLLALNIKGIV